MERHSFRIVLGDSPETMRKLCLSTKLSYQKIRWNYDTFRSVKQIEVSKESCYEVIDKCKGTVIQVVNKKVKMSHDESELFGILKQVAEENV